MAIKVGGTTVIDDSRNFTNIAGGFKTVNGTSVVGSGDISAGASTTYNAVGTYVFAFSNGTKFVNGSTYSGSVLYPAAMTTTGSFSSDDYQTFNGTKGGSALSGTWRAMGRNQAYWSHASSLFVRIS